MKPYVLGEFPLDEKCINAAWLREEMADLRYKLAGRSQSLHYSVFSPWRKQVGCSGSEEISKRHALLIVFLATYSRSGKDICGLKAVDLPHGIELNKYCKQWLEALTDRPECDAIYKVLEKIAIAIPTPEIVLTTTTIPRAVSKRTLQRYAKAEKVSLSMGKPLPRAVLRRVLKRCLPGCPMRGLI